MIINYTKYYVRIYKKYEKSESWQTLGPYDYNIATEIMNNYLKNGICCWVEDVKISE